MYDFQKGESKWTKRRHRTFWFEIGLVCAKAFELVEDLECWFARTKIVLFVISTRRRIFFSLFCTILLTNCCWGSFYSLLAVQSFDVHYTLFASTWISFFLKQLYLSAEWVCRKHFCFSKFLSWQEVLLATLRNFNWCFPCTKSSWTKLN